MVVLNKIYTRAGDGGTTRLATGEEVSKDDARVAAYGDVDECNATLGLARLHTGADPALDTVLERIQNDLFDLGADLATAERPGRDLGWEPLRITEGQVTRLEHDLDALNEPLGPLTSFILPAGSPAAAHLHLARTVCRRAERRAVTLGGREGEQVNPAAIKYLNRLSDFLFVAARHANARSGGDVLWKPGAGR